VQQRLAFRSLQVAAAELDALIASDGTNEEELMQDLKTVRRRSLATALALRCPIWTEDFDFSEQVRQSGGLAV